MTDREATPMDVRRAARWALAAYLVVSVLAAAFLAVVFWRRGLEGYCRLTDQGPLSFALWTNVTIATTWGLFGVALVLFSTRIPSRRNIVTIVALFFLALLYTNVLRERPEYGDIDDYYEAAVNLARGEPFHARYLYPPMWATVLRPLLGLGFNGVTVVCLFANLASLVLLFVLLQKTLKHYGFRPEVASVLCAAAMAVNAPILRNMGWVQVNVHVINLTLGSLLLHKRSRLLSAVCLSLAVHMKVSPLIFVLPFVVTRDWKWLIQFTAVTAGIVVVTSLAHGTGYYGSFLWNVSQLADYRFRSSSFDSLIGGALEHWFYRDPTPAKLLAVPLKLAVLAASAWVCVRAVKDRLFYTGPRNSEILFNTLPVLVFPMLLVAPVIWPHHCTWMLLPMLVMLRGLSSPARVMVFMTAWASLFWMPVFDIFPFSYHRLGALLLGLGLLIRFARDRRARAPWLDQFNLRLADGPLPAAEGRTEST